MKLKCHVKILVRRSRMKERKQKHSCIYIALFCCVYKSCVVFTYYNITMHSTPSQSAPSTKWKTNQKKTKFWSVIGGFELDDHPVFESQNAWMDWCPVSNTQPIWIFVCFGLGWRDGWIAVKLGPGTKIENCEPNRKNIGFIWCWLQSLEGNQMSKFNDKTCNRTWKGGLNLWWQND